MDTAQYLLFEKLFKGKPLFSSQVELVNRLLSHYKSGYYIQDNNSEEFKKSLNKLKAYISQLLSENTSRTLTPIFKHALREVISDKFANTDFDAEEIASRILGLLESMNRKNDQLPETFVQYTQELFQGIKEADEILIFAAREFNITFSHINTSLQDLLVYDFIQRLTNHQLSKKKFRFNFPGKQIGDLFWYSLKKALDGNLLSLLRSREHIKAIYSQELITTDLFQLLMHADEIDKNIISRTSVQILKHMAMSGKIVVYIVDDPVFAVPMIVLQPNAKSITAFLIVEDDFGHTSVNKLNKEDTVVWKYVTFDRLRLKKRGALLEFNVPT